MNTEEYVIHQKIQDAIKGSVVVVKKVDIEYYHREDEIEKIQELNIDIFVIRLSKKIIEDFKNHICKINDTFMEPHTTIFYSVRLGDKIGISAWATYENGIRWSK